MPNKLWDETGQLKKTTRTAVKARQKATDSQWWMVEEAVKAFIAKYPIVWQEFVKDTQKERDFTNPYSLGKLQSGKQMKTEFRKTGVFPSVMNKEGELVDGLLPVLEGIIPGLCHKDSVNYVELLRRYPEFRPSYKTNV